MKSDLEIVSRPRCRMNKMVVSAVIGWLLTGAVFGKTWVIDSNAFREFRGNGFASDPEGRLILSKNSNGSFISNAVWTSTVFDCSNEGGLSFMAWVSQEPEATGLRMAYRGSPKPFTGSNAELAWVSAENSVPISNGTSRKYFQIRAVFSTSHPSRSPALREVFLSSKSLKEKNQRVGIPDPRDLAMTMIYGSTMEKVYSVYARLPFNASERGMYIFRNETNVPISEETYKYRSGVNGATEMYLPMRFDSKVILRVHPYAGFQKLSIAPGPVVMRSKMGVERTAPMAQSRSIHFFDEAYLDEFTAGLGAMVDYCKIENPNVFGYTLMAPEFFYDTEPWPQQTYLGGFGELAMEHYRDFQKKLGREVSVWPEPSDGDVSLDADYYLWAYWRTRAAADYIRRLARVVKQKDPSALVGTMHYVGAHNLRGLEPAFIETSPDFDYYYSANMYPRVPGTNGFDGGTTFSYTRLNALGNSKKLNLVEYDVYSPYIDFKRSLVFARYAQLQGILPVPIIMGDYPTGNKPESHLTKYHGMKAEPMTPAVLAKLGQHVRETSALRQTRMESQVAVILPTISTFAILEKSRWLAHRLQQLSLHLLAPLLSLGAPFDFLTEGYASTEILDRYRLVIVFQPAVYPWMRKALAETKANILALGWAGTISAPGPFVIDAPIDTKSFSRELSSAWTRGDQPVTTTLFPTGGRVQERESVLQFKSGPHRLLRGLENKTVEYAGDGLDGRALPYVAGLKGEALAVDVNGDVVYAVLRDKGRSVIHLGALPYFRDPKGRERGFLTEVDQKQFFANVLDECGVEYFPDLGPLHVMKTSRFLLLENTSDKVWSGIPPKAVNQRSWSVDSREVQIAPLESLVLEVRQSP